jgi:hypothetical protein
MSLKMEYTLSVAESQKYFVRDIPKFPALVRAGSERYLAVCSQLNDTIILTNTRTGSTSTVLKDESGFMVELEPQGTVLILTQE